MSRLTFPSLIRPSALGRDWADGAITRTAPLLCDWLPPRKSPPPSASITVEMTPWESRALQTGGETRRTRESADTHTETRTDPRTHARATHSPRRVQVSQGARSSRVAVMKRNHDFSSSDSELDETVEVEKESADEAGWVFKGFIYFKRRRRENRKKEAADARFVFGDGLLTRCLPHFEGTWALRCAPCLPPHPLRCRRGKDAEGWVMSHTSRDRGRKRNKRTFFFLFEKWK